VRTERLDLKVSDLRGGYGRIEVLHSIDLEVGDGEAVALLGANGAGKTTTLRAVSGLLRGARGTIRFGQHDLTRLRPHDIVRLGIAHVPQGAEIFQRQTVLDNLLVSSYVQRGDPTGRLQEVLRLFPVLETKLDSLGGQLSGGQQQMLAIARGLMARPRLLLLDEPTLGLAPVVALELQDMIMQVRSEQGVGLLLVEQNARMALEIADRAYVLRRGTVVLKDSSAKLRQDARLVSAYLR
jgi:branched-chain amino acid transport system ATP-binding protein